MSERRPPSDAASVDCAPPSLRSMVHIALEERDLMLAHEFWQKIEPEGPRGPIGSDAYAAAFDLSLIHI